MTAAPEGSSRRIGPLSVLAACILPIAGAFAIRDARVGLTALAAEVILLGWLVVDPAAAARRLALGALAGLSIGLTTWLYGGHDLDVALGASSRILYVVLPSALLTPRIVPSELGDHLAQRLRLPPRVAVAAVVALQRLDGMGEQWQQIQRARRARGLGLDGGPVRRARGSAGAALAMPVASMRHTGQLALAMDARGFAGANNRSWARPAPWHGADRLVLALGAVLAALPWLLR